MIDDESDIKDGELPEGFHEESEEPIDVVDPLVEEEIPVDPFEEAFPKDGDEVPELNDDAKEMEEYIFAELGYEDR